MFSFGGDPEFMLFYAGKIRSAIPVIGHGHLDKITHDNSCCFYDNVLAEIGFQPASSKQNAVDNIKKSLVLLKRTVQPYQIMVNAASYYESKELDAPQARKFGCSPERSAYTLETINFPSWEIKHGSLRTAGGHIHLGYTPTTRSIPLTRILIVKLLDLFVGIPLVFLDSSDASRLRKKIAGAAGTFRQTTYGLEYRVPSNYWLKSPNLVELVYDLCEFTVNFVLQEKDKDFWLFDKDSKTFTCLNYDVDAVRDIIDNNNSNAAEAYLDFLPQTFVHQIRQMKDTVFQNLDLEWNL